MANQAQRLTAVRQERGTWRVDYLEAWQYSPEIVTTKCRYFTTRMTAQEFIRDMTATAKGTRKAA